MLASKAVLPILGAVLGVAVGGAISFALQIRSFDEARRTRENEEQQKRKALGTSLLFKVIRIYTGLTHIKDHFDECHASKHQFGINVEPFQYVRPILNLPTGEKFSADELALLVSLKDDEVTNTVISLDDIYEAVLGALIALNRFIEVFRTGLAAQFEDELVEIKVPHDELKFVRPKMIDVNSIAMQSQKLVLKYQPRAERAFDALSKLLKDKLDIGIEFSKVVKN